MELVPVAVAAAIAVAGCKHAAPETAGAVASEGEAGRRAPATGALDASDGDVGLTLHDASAEPIFLGGDVRPWRRDQSCAATFRPSDDAISDLQKLGELCAEGMKPLLRAPVTVAMGPGSDADQELPFRAARSVCLRAAVVATPGSYAIKLAIASPNELLAATASSESVAVAPPGGPVCVRDAGEYRLRVQARFGKSDAGQEPRTGSMTIQLWQAAARD